jgi:hypothetical protein
MCFLSPVMIVEVEFLILYDTICIGALEALVHSAGAYDFDMSAVYSELNHEVYRRWLVLSDVTDEFEGVQGYLKLSVVVRALSLSLSLSSFFFSLSLFIRCCGL